MNITKEKVLFSKRKREIKDLYFSAFPKEERMPFVMMILMSVLWNTEFFAFYDNDALCGMIYLANIGKQTFIMFFAVPEKLRSNGYGSAILREIKTLYPDNRIIVSIEPCCEDAEDIANRIRRKNFYQANGYMPSGYYIKLNSCVQEVLICNGEFDKKKFIAFFMLYSNCTVIPKIWKEDIVT